MRGLVALTGANGFIGSHVAEVLLDAGYAVRCLLRPQSDPRWVDTLPVDIQRIHYGDPLSVRRAVAGCQAILHFGGATKAADREGYFKANAATTQALLDAAAHAGSDFRLFLLCSSQAALGPSPGIDPLSEDAPPHPITPYGESKLAAEKMCREYEGRFPIAVLRPPAVYGPRDRDILIFFKLVKCWISPTIGGKDRFFSLVHGRDVARAARMILDGDITGLRIYHVTDGVLHRWSEVADTIARVLNRRPFHLRIPLPLAVAVSRLAARGSSLAGRIATLNRDKLEDLLQPYWIISSRRIEEELGFQPTYDLESGLEMTAAWYRERGWI
jgi:nucleoside-diphosphate-sugar epimerase